MTNSFTQHLCTVLLGIVILSSCSRPTAYFQRSSIEPSARTLATTVNAAAPTQTAATPVEVITKANETITQLETYVRNDSKLSTNKRLTERMNRIKTMLASSNGTLDSKAVSAPQKTNIMQRLMLKKINRQINKQLAPNHTEKTTVQPVILIGGIILLIGGLILLIAGSGTLAFIGLILALIGALGTVLGLFGQ